MVNHYPLFSETVDRGDNKQLIQEWGPQLQEHDISLAFAGHDHTLQHLQVEGYKPKLHRVGRRQHTVVRLPRLGGAGS